MVRLLTFLFLSAILSSEVSAQQKNRIQGVVTDKTTSEPLPFASVSLKNSMVGTITNNEGEFELQVLPEQKSDTLIISSLGYSNFVIPLSKVNSPLKIELLKSPYSLSEVVVRPMLPTDYIKAALRRVKQNYPSTPFQTQAYYKEYTTENNRTVNMQEGVFLTYFPSYQDTTPNQHQLLLFRKVENPSKLEFMKEKREKKKAKKEKQDKKKGIEKKEEEEYAGLMLGGPESALKLDILKYKDAFLDSNSFKKFRYSFGGTTSYQGREITIINFESKKAVDNLKQKGKILIDEDSKAFVSIDYNGDFVIPLLIKPILFAMGISIDDGYFERKVNYQLFNDYWYPQHFTWMGSGKLTKRHFFKPNEKSDLKIEQLLLINQVRTKNATPIPAEKRINPKKEMNTQVKNDVGIKWEDVNRLK